MKHLTASISEEKRQYIPITFELIDSGYGGISGDELALYLAARRFVCRTENHRLGGYFKSGLLVSSGWLENWTRYVSGCSKSKISRLFDKLEERGFLTKIIERGEEPLFVLGEWKKVEFGNEVVALEYFYADFVEMQKASVVPLQKPVASTQQPCNNPATTLQPSNIEVEKYSSIEENNIPPRQNSASSPYQVRVEKEKATPHVIVPDAIDQANLRDNPDMNPDGKADPLSFGLERKTEAAQAEAVAYADPLDDVLVDTAISLLCNGRAPKKGNGTYRDMANVIGEVHIAFGLNDERPAVALSAVRQAVELFMAEKPDLTVYRYPSFSANYGQYLSRVLSGKKGAQQHGSHQRTIAPNAVPRRAATEAEARAILGDDYFDRA
jgi:hypothetical protein